MNAYHLLSKHEFSREIAESAIHEMLFLEHYPDLDRFSPCYFLIFGHLILPAFPPRNRLLCTWLYMVQHDLIYFAAAALLEELNQYAVPLSVI